MINVFPVGGYPGGECFLCVGDGGSFLVDSGFGFAAGRVIQNIEHVLNGNGPDYILLTHSHYDHVGASGLIKQRWPTAKVAASPKTAAIFEKENARALMQKLDGQAADAAKMPGRGEFAQALCVDVPVAEGDVLRAGNVAVRVLETPGHTACSVSFYFEDDGLLAASETTGVENGEGGVVPAFIVGYSAALAAAGKLEALGPQRIMVPHTGVLSATQAGSFFARARSACTNAADFITQMAREGRTPEQMAMTYRDCHYRGAYAAKQPEEAFLLNTRAMIPRLLKELGVDARLHSTK